MPSINPSDKKGLMSSVRRAASAAARLDSREVMANPRVRVGVNKVTRFLLAVLRTFLLIGLSFIILYPLLYMLSVSFREQKELYDPTVVWIPKSLTLDNFRFTITEMDYVPALLRTLALTLSCTVVQVFTCAVTGYGFARFRFRGRSVLFFLALFTLIVPPQSINMPLYVNYVSFTDWTAKLFGGEGFQILDTFIPMVLPAVLGVGIRAGLFVYLFRQYFKNMPLELEEAAYLDGCGPIAAFFRIMLVNAGPILLVSFLFSFVWYWNDYLNVSLFFDKAQPLSMVVANFGHYLSSFKLPDGSALARALLGVYVQVGALLFIAPVLVIYLFLQKYFTQSIVRAGIVG